MQNTPKNQTWHLDDQVPLTAAMLAAVPEWERKEMLGIRLFPRLRDMHGELAPKITGMLLELDNAEVLHILQHRACLEAKAEEAVGLLQAHQQAIKDEMPLTAGMLTGASLGDRNEMFGIRLYTKLRMKYGNLTPKITGMLLELDNSELLYMLEHKAALEAKAAEAAALWEAHKTSTDTINE